MPPRHSVGVVPKELGNSRITSCRAETVFGNLMLALVGGKEQHGASAERE